MGDAKPLYRTPKIRRHINSLMSEGEKVVDIKRISYVGETSSEG